ncbi:thymidine phosphorylase [Mycolicibacterium phlei]|uniref:thymidine phosphorylase n=1 Tax=Mycolicibacterium phlei TaxID=1771 RepID=UPI003F49695F
MALRARLHPAGAGAAHRDGPVRWCGVGQPEAVDRGVPARLGGLVDGGRVALARHRRALRRCRRCGTGRQRRHRGRRSGRGGLLRGGALVAAALGDEQDRQHHDDHDRDRERDMACGGAVPQAAGRGLGHTGGTLDKLESIPGFSAELPKERIRQQLCELGAAIFAAGELAPADRKIYALRDITATTESLPLIASSVMSKKIAEGARALVLDTKVGSGAFLKTEAESRELARTMVDLGSAHGLSTRALLTDMATPLGRAVGNAVEVEESLEVLAGGGPRDVVELTLALAREMLDAAGLDGVDPADTLRDGTAMDRFRALVAAQGGDLNRPLPVGRCSETLTASSTGVVRRLDALAVGLAVWRLGAGRSAPGEQVQFGAGLRIHRREGEPVTAGEPLLTLYTDTPERFAAAVAELDGAVDIGDTAPPPRPLIIDRIV